jgi:LPS export ABC transporter permease LptF/LPS export ABC transporter permease LptG
MRIIDRYVMRQVLMPFCIGLIVFTFVFIIQTLIRYVEPLIAKGVSTEVLVRVLLLLIPQALALSIPMSLLLALLVAFGRLSSGREFVALQACGVSLRRLLLPVGAVSTLGWAATSYVMLVAVPESNQAFRELTFSVMADRAEGEVRPRVFFEDFPGLTLYVQDVPPEGGWAGVFMADFRPNQPRAVYLAREGHVRIDRVRRSVEVALADGIRHVPDDAAASELIRFDRITVALDPTSLFPTGGPLKSDREMSIAELREKIALHEANGISTHNQVMAIHQKFAIPLACVVFGVIGLALGATNRRDGALGSFGMGIAVVFAYYVPLFFFPAMTKGGYLPPWLAVWLPNILLGLFALVLFVWRDRVADQPLRLPAWLPRRRARPSTGGPRRRLTLRPLRLLDAYVTGTYIRIFVLTFAAALAVFYISTFIDHSDELFKGTVGPSTLLQYFAYATPQFVYYVLPLSVLIATLVTVGMLTGSSELIVMRACGVSLYRAAMPMLACAAIVGGLLFVMDATVLGTANRRADALDDQLRGGSRLVTPHQPWRRGANGEVYHVEAFDRDTQRFHALDVWRVDPAMSRLIEQTWAREASYVQTDGNTAGLLRLQSGWTRAFDGDGRSRHFHEFDTEVRALGAAASFAQEPPDARFMSFRELQAETSRLAAAGFDVLEQQVELARKVAFPFVGVIMALIAIPFAVTIGRSGTMAGIGVGVALALVYWGAISIAAALGAGGALHPALAAWAPNLLFAAGALYLLLTVRT